MGEAFSFASVKFSEERVELCCESLHQTQGAKSLLQLIISLHIAGISFFFSFKGAVFLFLVVTRARPLPSAIFMQPADLSWFVSVISDSGGISYNLPVT